MDKAEVLRDFQEMLQVRADWESEWRELAQFLIPGRGIGQLYTSPQRFRLSPTKVINNTGGEALDIFVSAVEAAGVSATRPWFSLKFRDVRLGDIKELKVWLEQCQKRLNLLFHISNFYTVFSTFLREDGGFGTSAMYIGEDAYPWRCEFVPVGEFCVSYGVDGRPDKFFRTILKTNRLLEKEFGKLPQNLKDRVKDAPEEFTIVLQAVVPETYMKMPYKSYYMEYGYSQNGRVQSADMLSSVGQGDTNFLKVSGYSEFPFIIGRCTVEGNDSYGVGLGSKALADIKRLQEMEKTFMMGAHKTSDPPVQAPGTMRGKINKLPGGESFYSNPNAKIDRLYNFDPDLKPVLMAIERCEERIKRVFYNDLFLSASRDPNLSPLKAAEVHSRDDDKATRMSPVINRLSSDVLTEVIHRVFNIALRKDLLPPLDPRMMQMLAQSGMEIQYVSPLLQSQKLYAMRPLTQFLGFASSVAQFSPQAMDKLDVDAIIEEGADITGVQQTIIRSPEQVQQIREARQKALEQEKQKQQAAEQMAAGRAQSEQQQIQAQTAQALSEAGVNFSEAVSSGVI